MPGLHLEPVSLRELHIDRLPRAIQAQLANYLSLKKNLANVLSLNSHIPGECYPRNEAEVVRNYKSNVALADEL